ATLSRAFSTVADWPAILSSRRAAALRQRERDITTRPLRGQRYDVHPATTASSTPYRRPLYEQACRAAIRPDANHQGQMRRSGPLVAPRAARRSRLSVTAPSRRPPAI